MDVSAVSALTQQPTASENAETTLSDTFDTFLTLLTTQLRYQDPLEPMDSSEFTSQLVQFSQVEQSISTNTNLEKLLGFQGANQAVAAIGYIGTSVEALSNALPLVDGSATMNYVLAEKAESAKVLVYDAAGDQVRSIESATSLGKHTVTWDGKDDAGNTLPDGAYTVVVSARDADINLIEVATSITATVTGTQNSDTGTQLIFGTVPIDLDKVISVTDQNANGGGNDAQAEDEEGGDDEEPAA
ncbi:MAG: flagellar basal-body rod modification protein FlgD [Paracoccaceae bacterium]|jgi:flagellar basal-body rod modification protein FlgD